MIWEGIDLPDNWEEAPASYFMPRTVQGTFGKHRLRIEKTKEGWFYTSMDEAFVSVLGHIDEGFHDTVEEAVAWCVERVLAGGELCTGKE